jgi:hypothetical protein
MSSVAAWAPRAGEEYGREDDMVLRTAIHAVVLAAALATTGLAAQAFDQTRYPDLRGQWRRAETGTFRFDPAKPWGPGQKRR